MVIVNHQLNWQACDFTVKGIEGAWGKVAPTYTQNNRPYFYWLDNRLCRKKLYTYWLHQQSNHLVVLFHPFNSGAREMRHVALVVHKAFPEADILIPEFPAGIVDDTNPLAVVQQITALLDAVCQEHLFEDIYFVGHSLGSVIARKIYACAWKQTEIAPFETELEHLDTDRLWATKVKRIILLAGLSQGWQISHHLPLGQALAQKVGCFIGDIRTLLRHPPFIYGFRRGAPFMTQLRIQWIAMGHMLNERFKNDEQFKNQARCLTIQLLGTQDDIVSPEDNVDPVAGSNFVYLDVPKSGHANIAEMYPFWLDDDTLRATFSHLTKEELIAGQKRAKILYRALKSDRSELEKEQILPFDQRFPEPNENIEHVVFVIHGIRDRGYWTNKIARRIQREYANRGESCAIETSTYGYFPLLSFLIPFRRREKMEWLMGQYAEDLALYPRADFHYVGHSNGTYLLTKALEEYPCCRFNHVVFAGSVVSVMYDWKTKIRNYQVDRVLNFVATQDWVVAFFPKLFQFLGWKWQGLGSAGHDGFQELQEVNESDYLSSRTIPRPGYNKGDGLIYQVKYIQGGHGAALVENNWDTISEFVVNGIVDPRQIDPSPQEVDRAQFKMSGEKSLIERWIELVGHVPILVWLILGIIAFGIVKLILMTNWAEWQKTIVLTGYTWVLWRILTRF